MGPSGAGELRERVRFERRIDADDGYGNKKGDWLPLIPRRSAKLRATRGGEQTIAARMQGTASFDCWIHYERSLLDLTTDDRVVELAEDGSDRRKFDIKFGPEDMDGNRKWLFLQLELGGAT